jgi:hypothetical protein
MHGAKPEAKLTIAQKITAPIEIVLSNLQRCFCPKIKLAGSKGSNRRVVSFNGATGITIGHQSH